MFSIIVVQYVKEKTKIRIQEETKYYYKVNQGSRKFSISSGVINHHNAPPTDSESGKFVCKAWGFKPPLFLLVPFYHPVELNQ